MRGACAALLLFACAHAKAAAPEPDRDAIAEVTRSYEPDTYVSARAYQHYLDALLARTDEDYARAASELTEALVYDPQSAHLHTVLADVRLKQGRVADAEEELHRALALEPDHAAAHLLLARIDVARAKGEEAFGELRAAIAAAPAEPDAYRELIRLQLEQGDAASAIASAAQLSAQSQAAQKRAQQGDPAGEALVQADRLRAQSAAGWVDIARDLQQRHDGDGARRAFDEALAIDPSDWDAISAEGAFLETQRDFEGARKLYLRLLAQRPEAPDVLAALARLALEEGDLDTVDAHRRKLLDLAADLDPQGTGGQEQEDERREASSALLRVAVSLLGAHRSAAAQSALEGALRLYPGQPELLFYRAMALTQRGRPREGAAQFDEVAHRLASHDLQPSFLGVEVPALLLDARVQEALARGRAGETRESLRRLEALFAVHAEDEGTALALLEGFDRAGKPREAAALLLAQSKAHPGTGSLLYALANAQDRIGERTAALATMRKLLAISPDHSGALNYIGYTLTEMGDAAQGRPLLARAVELRPDDGAVADSYGYCLLKLGLAQEALGELRRADRLSPGDPVILSHLGDALLAHGDRKDALQTFQKALSRLNERTPQPRAPRASDVATLAPDPPDRLPDPGDEKVRNDLAGKVRALSP